MAPCFHDTSKTYNVMYQLSKTANTIWKVWAPKFRIDNYSKISNDVHFFLKVKASVCQPKKYKVSSFLLTFNYFTLRKPPSCLKVYFITVDITEASYNKQPQLCFLRKNVCSSLFNIIFSYTNPKLY